MNICMCKPTNNITMLLVGVFIGQLAPTILLQKTYNTWHMTYLYYGDN